MELTDLARVRLPAGALDVRWTVDCARRYPAHFHETFVIGLIESGYHWVTTQRGRWLARPPMVIALSPGETHSVEPVNPEGVTCRAVYPSVEFMRSIGIPPALLSTGRPLFREPVIADPDLAIRLRRAALPLFAGETQADALSEVLRVLVERHAGAPARRPPRRSDEDLATCTQEYLRRRVHEQVSISRLARELGVSTFRLIRAFRRVMGLPPYAYLVQLRVNQAQRLLATGEKVTRVAHTCGFSDQSHLTRAFTRTTGLPPGLYRRKTAPAG